MFTNRTMFAVLFSLMLLGTGVISCSQQEGPAEKAGKKIDETMEKTGQAMNEAAEEVKEEAKGMMEKAEETTKSEEKL